MTLTCFKTFCRSFCQCGPSIEDVEMEEIGSIQAKDGTVPMQPTENTTNKLGNEPQPDSQSEAASVESKGVRPSVEPGDKEEPDDAKKPDAVSAQPDISDQDADAAGGNAAAADQPQDEAAAAVESEKNREEELVDNFAGSSPATTENQSVPRKDAEAGGDDRCSSKPELVHAAPDLKNTAQAHQDETHDQTTKSDSAISARASEISQPGRGGNSKKQAADGTAAGVEKSDNKLVTEGKVATSNVSSEPGAVDPDTIGSSSIMESPPESVNHGDLADSGRKGAAKSNLEVEEANGRETIATLDQSGNPGALDISEDVKLSQELKKASMSQDVVQKPVNAGKAEGHVVAHGNWRSSDSPRGEKKQDCPGGPGASATVEEFHLDEQLKDFNCKLKLKPIVAGDNHTVCVSVRNYKEGSIPQPHPAKRRDKWDSSHVGMPFSSKNEFPVKEGNQTVIKERFIFQILMTELTKIMCSLRHLLVQLDNWISISFSRL